MKRVLGKEVLDSLDEWVMPSHSALLIVDMQNDYLASGGTFERDGKDLSMIRAAVPKMKQLLHAARDAGVMCIFIQQTLLANAISESPAHLLFRTRDGRTPAYTVHGTWGHEVIDELTPRADELGIWKYRSSGFVGTNLDNVLRANAKHTVVVAGLWSDGCVFATASHASWLDYYVLVVEDCTAANSAERHEAAMKLLRARHPVARADELIKVWLGHTVGTINRGWP